MRVQIKRQIVLFVRTFSTDIIPLLSPRRLPNAIIGLRYSFVARRFSHKYCRRNIISDKFLDLPSSLSYVARGRPPLGTSICPLTTFLKQQIQDCCRQRNLPTDHHLINFSSTNIYFCRREMSPKSHIILLNILWRRNQHERNRRRLVKFVDIQMLKHCSACCQSEPMLNSMHSDIPASRAVTSYSRYPSLLRV